MEARSQSQKALLVHYIIVVVVNVYGSIFEIGSATESRAYCFGENGWPANPWYSPLSTSTPVLGSQACAANVQPLSGC